MKLTNRLLHALLVACDQSYKATKDGIKPDDDLAEYWDTQGMVPSTDFMPTIWKTNGDLQGWTVARRFDDLDTGFGATVYKKPVAGQPGKFDYIVALQGTRGPSPQDYFDDITYGWRKFNSDRDEGGRALINYLTSNAILEGGAGPDLLLGGAGDLHGKDYLAGGVFNNANCNRTNDFAWRIAA